MLHASQQISPRRPLDDVVEAGDRASSDWCVRELTELERAMDGLTALAGLLASVSGLLHIVRDN